jgi:hypothetical protein
MTTLGSQQIIQHRSAEQTSTIYSIMQSPILSDIDDGYLLENIIGMPSAALGGADLNYSTFLGGDEYDLGTVITLGADGSIYIAGTTQSDNFPTTPGAFCRTHTGSDDIFVCKLSPDGQTLMYSTLIGGRGTDTPTDIEVDAVGCAYLVGYTYDYLFDFPTTTGAINETSNGEYDVFILKLNADGTDLEYSTVLGGDKNDFGRAIAIDAEGCAYIAGYTGMHSTIGFPTTTGAYDRTNSDWDGFMCKISANGQELLNSTFIGGDGSDTAWGIELDSDGYVYLAGSASAGFPTTDGAYDTSHNGNYDAYVCKMSSDGSELLFSTLIGGDSNDRCFRMVMDAEGCFYLTGFTTDGTIDFPTTNGAYDTDYNGGAYDMYVCKVSADGSNLLYSTFMGGSGTDIPNGIAVDAEGCVHIIGDINGDTTGFPTTDGAINTTAPGGGYDGCAFKLSADGGELLYSTFLGGSGEDVNYGIIVDSANYVYVTGGTQETTTNYPTTSDAMNETHNGLTGCYDLYYSKIDMGPASPSFITSSQTSQKAIITIQWNAVAGASQYKIYVNEVLKATIGGTITSQDINLNENGIYSITVSALRNGHESGQSAAISITVDIPPINWGLIIGIIVAAIGVVVTVIVMKFKQKQKLKPEN